MNQITNAVDFANTTHRTIPGYRPAAGELVPLVAIVCVASYVLRHSLVPTVVSNPYVDLIGPLSIITLFVATAYVAASGIGRINTLGIVLIAATGASLIHCERFAFALPRWLGWVVLLVALGPINSTRSARALRSRLLAVLNAAFIVITLLSTLWWMARLPNLGRGDFTGVMAHSMVLGPIASYVAVLSIVHLFSGGSYVWAVCCVNAWLVAMLASSRAAVAAAAIGTLMVIAANFRRNLVLAGSLIVATLMVAIAPNEVLNLAGQLLPSSLTEGLANKSWNNSREQHWSARWDEFVSAPWTGIGFASAWEDSVGVDAEAGTVEPGSSYISILSMTGCVGAAAWLLFVASFAAFVAKRWRGFATRDRLSVAGMASFWLVHLAAEGYIYAVGSIIGITFWLWLGCLYDELCVQSHPRTQSRRRPRSLGQRPRQQTPASSHTPGLTVK